MKVILVFLVIHYGLVNGLQMCKGPLAPPTFEKMAANPVYDYRNRMTEATFSLEVTSRQRLSLYWWTFGIGGGEFRYRQSSGDSEDFRSTTAKSGDSYVFKLRVKPDGEVKANISELSRTISFDMQIVYDCSAVSYTLDVLTMMQAIRAKASFVTFTEIPRGRYYVPRGGEYTVKLGITHGPGKPAPKADFGCRKQMERRHGALFYPKSQSLFDDTNKLNSTTETLGSTGVMEGRCQIGYGVSVLESYHVAVFLNVEFDSPNVKNGYVMWFSVNLRRPGIKSAALLVSAAYARDNKPGDRNDLVLLTRKDTTHISCVADADNAPYVAAARLERGGKVQVLNGIFHASNPALNSVLFSVKSPNLGHGEEFICSAASGQDVVSQKFTVYRHQPVVVKVADKGVVMVKGRNSSFNLSCEATGTPQPDIRFLWRSTGVVTSIDIDAMLQNEDSNTASFLEKNHDDVITDTDLFETDIRRGQGTTYAWIVLKDVDKILESLPENYWDTNVRFSIECAAYNRYTHDVEEVATIENPNFGGFGNMMDGKK